MLQEKMQQGRLLEGEGHESAQIYEAARTPAILIDERCYLSTGEVSFCSIPFVFDNENVQVARKMCMKKSNLAARSLPCCSFVSRPLALSLDTA